MKAGELEAETVDDVEAHLRSLGLSPIRVRRAYLRAPLRRLRSLRWWITKRDRQIVGIQLRTMREAGLPLLQCIDILERVADGPVARRIGGIKRALQSGMGHAEALVNAGGDLFESADALVFAESSRPDVAGEHPVEDPGRWS